MSGRLFINSRYDTRQKILDFVNAQKGRFANTTEYAPYLHELGHKFYYDSVKSIAKSREVSYIKAQGIVDARIYEYVHSMLLEGKTLELSLSRYANEGYRKQKYTEVIAESFSVKDENVVAKDLIGLLEKEVGSR